MPGWSAPLQQLRSRWTSGGLGLSAGLPGVLLLLACQHVTSEDRAGKCGSCHPTAVAEWSTSRHAAAFENPIFQLSWSEAHDPWCLDCHLPAEGVSCAVCHGPDPKRCADCHEFDLPKEIGVSPSGTLAQSTVSEWEASGAAELGLGCIDCHPPHHPSGGNDRQRVRAAIGAHVVADGDTVHATITTQDIGHAFPTGDPFRRLQLTVAADLAGQRPIARVELERRLERTADGGWTLGLDTRVPAPATGLDGARTFTLHAPAARSWTLMMHLSDPRHTEELGALAGYVVANGPVETR